jgi:serine/threonine protein kinase
MHFGIEKIQELDGAYDASLTSPDLIIGTPQYMSPEQCSQAEQIDSRTDIYSLGVILFEMLVGHVPFVGDSATAIMLKHLQEKPPSVLEERRDLPSGVAVVVARALAKRREDRYQHAGELVEDLVIAEGTGMVQADAGDRSTNRIVVPTANWAPGAGAVDDEQTLVRSRTPDIMLPAAPQAPPPPRMTVNPWRIIIPALAGLLVVFAVVYAFTLTSKPAANSNQQQPSTLSADPNSQAVQPAAPPTGKSEQGIPLGGVTKPSSNANTNANANPELSPTPLANENANTNDNRTVNANANRPSESPSPKHVIEATPVPTNPPLPSPKPTATAKPAETPPPVN